MQTGGKSQGRVPALNFEDGAPSTALYVGDLDKSLNEAFLYQLFQKVTTTQLSKPLSYSSTNETLYLTSTDWANWLYSGLPRLCH